MAQDWLLQFFCLILMKKGQKYQQQLLTLSCILHKSKQKTQPKHFGARFVMLLFVYIFSVFFLTPTHPPTTAARAQRKCVQKQLTFVSFLIQKIASRQKILIKTKIQKQEIFNFEAPNS